jgi:hypothetical protein
MTMRKKAGPEQGRARRAAIVSEAGAHAALRRGPTRELSAEEEKVMRMRLGASPPRPAPLERSYEPLSDLEIEVRAAEIEAWMRWKARTPSRPLPSAAAPQPSRPPPRASPAASAASPRTSIAPPRGPQTMSAAPPRFQISKERIIRALRRKT